MQAVVLNAYNHVQDQVLSVITSHKSYIEGM